jgi:hypothetical protein
MAYEENIKEIKRLDDELDEDIYLAIEDFIINLNTKLEDLDQGEIEEKIDTFLTKTQKTFKLNNKIIQKLKNFIKSALFVKIESDNE